MCKDLGRWGVTSLVKSFYKFAFSYTEDVRRVRTNVSWSLNPSVLKLFAWTKDFNPKVQQHAFAQVWGKDLWFGLRILVSKYFICQC